MDYLIDYTKEKEIFQLLESIEIILEEGKTSFMSNKIAVNRDEIMNIIKDIRVKLPGELQQSTWIVEERNKILAQANEDAKLIVQEAEDSIEKMVEQHEITRFAEERAQYILQNARESSREMHNGAVAYAANTLAHLEQDLNKYTGYMESHTKQTVDVLEKELQNTIDAMNYEVKTCLDKMLEEVKNFDRNTKKVLVEVYENREELEASQQHAPLRVEAKTS